MPFFLLSGTHTEQARIALKFYKWMGKGLYFQNIQRKKIRKNNVESSIEPPAAKSYYSASGRFFHSGSHVLYVYGLPENQSCLRVTQHAPLLSTLSNGNWCKHDRFLYTVAISIAYFGCLRAGDMTYPSTHSPSRTSLSTRTV